MRKIKAPDLSQQRLYAWLKKPSCRALACGIGPEGLRDAVVAQCLKEGLSAVPAIESITYGLVTLSEVETEGMVFDWGIALRARASAR